MTSEELFEKGHGEITADVIDSFELISWQVQIMYLVLFALVLVIIRICQRIHGTSHYRMKEIGWHMTRTVLSQFDFSSIYMTINLVMFIFLMAMSAVILLYENLFSTELISRPQGTFIDTLDELAQSNKTACLLEGLGEIEYFKRPSNPTFQAIYERHMSNQKWATVSTGNVYRLINLITDHKCVLLQDEQGKIVLSRLYCAKMTNEGKEATTRIGRDSFARSIGMFMMNRQINSSLERLVSRT